jgi:hypothetical protein
MAATEFPSSGQVVWLELLTQQIASNCWFRLERTKQSGPRDQEYDLLLTHNYNDDRVVTYRHDSILDGAALRTAQHGFWRWHNNGGTLVLQIGYSKFGTSAEYIHVINMSPFQNVPEVCQDKLWCFGASGCYLCWVAQMNG